MFFSSPQIRMVKEEVDTLVDAVIRKPTPYEKMNKNFIDFIGFELLFTDGFRVGINFEPNTGKMEVADKLREIARKIEESR